MNTHCSKFCDILEPRCGDTEFDVFPLVTHCALDIICETAMGRSINAQEDSDTPYVRAIYQASDVVFQRQRYTMIEFLFKVLMKVSLALGRLDILPHPSRVEVEADPLHAPRLHQESDCREEGRVRQL